MVAYGLSMCLEGYAGLHRIQHLFDECELSRPPREEQVFPRIYPLPSMFETELVVNACHSEMVEIKLNPATVLHEHRGKLIMILGKIDANPNCDEFLEKLE